MDKLVLGVDGGGTKTVAWLARVRAKQEWDVLGRGAAGSSNLRAAGLEQALTNLLHAAKSAWSDAGQVVQPVDVAALALAGAGQADAQAQVEQWFMQQRLAHEVQVMHDARAVLLAGSPSGWGVALVAGTGAVALAEDPRGRQAVVGGWGYWFGDEGSAFWLGQSALRAATLAFDGRGPATALAGAILERLQITDSREMLAALSRSGDVRQAIAELADLVSTIAGRHDEVASQIIKEAVAHLVGLVRCSASKLSLGNEFPLALAGGVLCGSPLVLERLTRELRDQGVCPTSLQVTANPVLGCLRWASQQAAGH